MTNLRDTLVNEVNGVHAWARERADVEPELRWFARLELVDVEIGDTLATFNWHDPADDTRHGWRWEIVPDRLHLVGVHLEEDLYTTEPTEPDEHGIRWWGVHTTDD